MFLYPWGDMHSLNLGWFLMQFKEWVEKIQEYLDNGGGTSENLANVIAPVFNAENSYLTGDYVLYNDELYKAFEPVPAGTWNPDAWVRCLVTEEMGSSASGVDNVARLMIAGQYSNTYNYQKYAICRYSDKLWMCNTNLPAGGEEWEPSHWDEITVGAGLTGLRRSVETLSGNITNLIDAINNLDSNDIDNESPVTGTTVTEALNTLNGAISDEATARQSADTAIESGIAIIANGDTHAAIAKGQFVYIKNHSTITEGLYKATTAIPLNGTITSSYIVPVPNGGLNDLETVITGTTTLGSDIASSTRFTANGFEKCGRLVHVTIQLESLTSTDVSCPHQTQLISGLPLPQWQGVFLGTAWFSDASEQSVWRMLLKTDGTLESYWNNLIIPKAGSNFIIDFVYMTAQGV